MANDVRYKQYADAIVAAHLAWVAFLLVGTFVVLAVPGYAAAQIVFLSGTLFIRLIFFRGRCPLTVWEERLRQKVEPEYSHNGSFLKTYINTMFRTNFTRRGVNLTIAAFYILSYGIAILTLVFRRG